MTKAAIRAKRSEDWAKRNARGHRQIALHLAANEYQCLATHGLAQGPALKKFVLDQVAAAKQQVDRKKAAQDLAALRAEQARLEPRVASLKAQKAQCEHDVQVLRDLRDKTAVDIAKLRQEAEALALVALFGVQDIGRTIAKATGQ